MKMQIRIIFAFLLWLFCQTAMAANPPTTISPGSGSSPGTVVSSLTPTFSWNSASGATGYGLYIRDMTASGTPLIYPNSSGTTANPLTGTSFTMPPGYLVNGHIYRWNMTSFVGTTEGSAVSTVLYFQTPAVVAAVAATPPAATLPPTVIANPPIINAPGSASSPGTVLGSLTPIFGWNSASGATGYGLYIRDMTASGTPLIYPNSYGTTYSPLTGTSFLLPNGYLVNGHAYRWNMTSFNGSIESSTASGVLYFQTPQAVVSTPTTTLPNGGSSVGMVAVAPPTIISPGGSSSPGTTVSSLTLEFRWNSVNGANGYGLYIRDMTAAGTPLIYPNANGVTANPIAGMDMGLGPFFTLPAGYLVNGHTYRWNMTSFTGSIESSAVSGALYFQTPAAAVATTPPTTGIVNPPTINSPGTASSPGMVLGSLAPTFSWNSASGATGYGLYIRDMTAAGMPLIYPNASGTTYPPLTGTSLILPANVLVNGHSYRWNMTSFNGTTEILAVSSVLYFQTPPVVVANTPSSGSSLPITSTPSVAPPVAGQPDFSSSYYTTANIFWMSGNAPASTSPPNPPGCQLGNALGNCTWYAYGRMLQLGYTSSQLNAFRRDAKYWAADAAALGILTNGIPSAGAIAQSVSHDHVAVVESVNGNMVTISESAYFGPNNTGNYLWKEPSISSTWFDNYIHVGSTFPSTTATGSLPTSGGTVSGVAKSAVASSPQISASAVAPNQTTNTPALQSVAAKSVVATASKPVTYATLSMQTRPNEGGTVSDGGTYVSGSSQTVTATPNNGFIFECWTENGKIVSLSASYNFILNGNRSLVAHFRPNFRNRPFTPNSPPATKHP